MVTLYIASSEPYSGKTLTSIVLGTRWQRQGRKVGYMKPLGLLPIRVGGELTDEDAHFVAQRLNLESAPLTLCPILMTRETCHMAPEEAKEKVRAAYEAASAGVDVMIVSGTGSVIKRGSMIGFNGVTASTMLDAKVLLVGKCESFRDADSIVAARQALGDRVVGVIVNMVPPRIKEQMWDDVVPCLEKSGLTVLGMMPMDPILHSVS
ncbi:MAG: AAA family ATPase, partial [Armatimonadetes bacterium]|nr:AAA family ATPase [Armatimonadota bacterium]